MNKLQLHTRTNYHHDPLRNEQGHARTKKQRKNNKYINHSPIFIKGVGKEIQCLLGGTLNGTSQDTGIKGCYSTLIFVH